MGDNRQGIDWFAWFVACGFVGIVVLAMLKGIPSGESHDVVLMLITAVVTNYGTVVSYRYGSTVGSEAKNSTIGDLAKATATTATTASASAPAMTTTVTTSTAPEEVAP